MVYKPKLSYSDQVQHLEQKGISFALISKRQALIYLRDNNNLFKLSSYRKNFSKDITSTRYIHLDFAYLIDLAVIDMYLRALMLKMSLNIEHFAKVKLMCQITNDCFEDGYTVVQDFLQSLSAGDLAIFKSELSRNARSPYCRDAYCKYKGHFPVWVFLELISFGSFLSFYKFCAERFYRRANNKKEYTDMMNNFYIMLPIKRIRNASAHNNCVINDLKTKDSTNRVNYQVRRAVRSELGLGRESTKKKLANVRISQILTCLYAHKEIVSSQDVNNHVAKELHEFSTRLFSKNSYNDNEVIKSAFDVLSTAIDKWFPVV